MMQTCPIARDQTVAFHQGTHNTGPSTARLELQTQALIHRILLILSGASQCYTKLPRKSSQLTAIGKKMPG